MSAPISPTKLDDRQNHLRDVVGGSVSLGTATPMESWSLFEWAGRYNISNS